MRKLSPRLRVACSLSGILAAAVGAASCAGDEPELKTSKDALAASDKVILTAKDIEVARLDLEKGHSIGWYEPLPGLVVIGQGFVFPQKPIEVDDNLSPSEQYEQLAPGRPVPQALMEAEEREKQHAAAAERNGMDPGATIEAESQELSGASDISEERKTQKSIDDSACPWSWFEPLYCDVFSSWTFRWSYRTGTSYYTRNDTKATNVAMCSYRGAVRYRVKWRRWWDWSGDVDVIRQAGEGWTWERVEQSLDYDVESRVDDADGDGYHHCGSGLEP